MKRGTPDHPKVYELCELLKCDRPTAIGYLELLWHFAAKYAPQGDIGKYSDERIEAALDWSSGRWKRPGKLIAALVESGWIDQDDHHWLVIHDWAGPWLRPVVLRCTPGRIRAVDKSVLDERKEPNYWKSGSLPIIRASPTASSRLRKV